MNFKIVDSLNNKYFIFFIFILSTFLCLTIPNLVSDGMVMDGTLYACIARNLAEGAGSFWQLHFSDTIFTVFYEHPPLAIALESLWFRVFGDSIYVERLYSFTTLIITSGLIVWIWKEITGRLNSGWIPLLIYFSVKKVSWAFANNMLENTMVIFVCMSVLFFLISLRKKQILYLFLCGLALFLAFLSKGFTSLFILVLPFIHWLFQKKASFWKMLFQTIFIGAILLIALLSVYYSLSDDSRNLFLKYFYEKVFGKLDVQTVDSRLFIITAVIYHFIPALIISLIAIISTRIKHFKPNPLFPGSRNSVMYFSLAISGIIPIIISLKQSGHYALTTYPFMAIAIALLIQPYVAFWQEKLISNPLVYRIFRAVSYALLGLVFILIYLNIGRIGQDKEMIEDCHKIIAIVGEKSTIGLCPNMEKQFYLYAYYNRYGHVNLDRENVTNYQYLLTAKDCSTNDVYQDYEPVEIPTQHYILMQRKK